MGDRPELHAEVHQHELHEGLIPPGHSTAQMTHDVTIHMRTLKRERFPAMANNTGAQSGTKGPYCCKLPFQRKRLSEKADIK